MRENTFERVYSPENVFFPMNSDTHHVQLNRGGSNEYHNLCFEQKYEKKKKKKKISVLYLNFFSVFGGEIFYTFE